MIRIISMKTMSYFYIGADQRQMIDFIEEKGLIHRCKAGEPVDKWLAPANDRKTGIDSMACKGTVGN